MASNLNVVAVGGNLASDVQAIGNNKGIKGSIAVNGIKKVDGNYVDEVSFINFVAWGERWCGNICQYLKKGKGVNISGSLKQETWNDKNSGDKREKVIIIAKDIYLLSDGKGQGQSNNNNQGGGFYQGNNNQGGGSGGTTSNFSDDIPF